MFYCEAAVGLMVLVGLRLWLGSRVGFHVLISPPVRQAKNCLSGAEGHHLGHWKPGVSCRRKMEDLTGSPEQQNALYDQGISLPHSQAVRGLVVPIVGPARTGSYFLILSSS